MYAVIGLQLNEQTKFEVEKNPHPYKLSNSKCILTWHVAIFHETPNCLVVYCEASYLNLHEDAVTDAHRHCLAKFYS